MLGILFGVLGAAWWIFQERKLNALQDSTKALSTGPLTLAGILVGLGVLCLRLVSGKPEEVALDYNVTALVGFLAVSAAALLVDSVMDQHLGLTFRDRLIFLNGGYFIFCVVMAVVALALVADALGSETNTLAVNRIEPKLVAGTLLLKVMTKNEDWGLSLLGLVLMSVYAWVAVWDRVPEVRGIPLYCVLASIVLFIIVTKLVLSRRWPLITMPATPETPVPGGST